MFKSIDIETTARCNRKCEYCPNSLDIRERGDMPTGLIQKIIKELAELNFSGRISPNLYGEPLLDSRMPCIVDAISNLVPRSNIVLYTNGDFLDIVLFLDLIRHQNVKIKVTNHNSDLSQKKNMIKVMEYARINDMTEFIDYRSFYKDRGILHNRCGLVKHKLIKTTSICFAMRPAMYVQYTGNVVLCCNDYLGRSSYGNIMDTKLIDIWNSAKYVEDRAKLKKKERPEICRDCNCR